MLDYLKCEDRLKVRGVVFMLLDEARMWSKSIEVVKINKSLGGSCLRVYHLVKIQDILYGQIPNQIQTIVIVYVLGSICLISKSVSAGRHHLENKYQSHLINSLTNQGSKALTLILRQYPSPTNTQQTQDQNIKYLANYDSIYAYRSQTIIIQHDTIIMQDR